MAGGYNLVKANYDCFCETLHMIQELKGKFKYLNNLSSGGRTPRNSPIISDSNHNIFNGSNKIHNQGIIPLGA